MNSNLIKTVSRPLWVLSLSAAISACATSGVSNKRQLDPSYLKGVDAEYQVSDEATTDDGISSSQSRFTALKAMPRNDVAFSDAKLSARFKDSPAFQIAAKDMGIEDFLHYTMGELLNVNYILAPEVKGVKDKVTLNINEKVSARRLFQLVEQVLAERGLSLAFNDDIYLIAKHDPKSKAATRVGIGRSISSVPQASGTVLQVVPVLYGIKTSLKHTLEQLADVSVTIDVSQSALFIQGSSANLVRALELIQLLDSPATRGRHVGLVDLAFIDPTLYFEQISTLLENEGIPNSINNPENNNLVFVPLYQIGAVAVFAATEELLSRVRFWTHALDKPSEGDVKRYYVFHPKYARAKDIGDSLKPLIDSSSAASRPATAASSNQADSSGKSTGQLTSASRATGAANDKLTFVVDERSNALIFFSTGTQYKNMLPLIHKLDVLPKQVLLEVMIAEVKLIDNFKYGVEWALKQGDVSIGTKGAFGINDIGGLNILSLGTNAIDQIEANFFASNQNTNILSRPSLLVRDGVTASIEIGEQISVQGSTTDNLGGETRTVSSEYRDTGINISVTPTVNAQGVVIMAINQSLSNTVPNSAGSGGNPSIFNRKLSTEVVAESGQTIMLAGLIDEQKDDSVSKVPGLGDLPLIGRLFHSKGDSATKTELVLLITPKVINRSEQWDDILSRFRSGLTGIDIP